MATQTTRKYIMNSFDNVYSAGYCSLQTILREMDRKWYTFGTYGWNADVYMLDIDTVIVTGYRPFGKRIPPEFMEYEDRARKIMDDYSIPWDERCAACNDIAKEFFEKIKEAR